MATHERKDRPSGEEERAGEKRARDASARAVIPGAPPPEQEEAPELLGERSDYPAPYGEGDEAKDR